MTINAVQQEISLAVDYIRETLNKKKVRTREIVRSALSAEEVLIAMIAHADSPQEKISVTVSSGLGNIEIRIRGKGTPFDTAKIRETASFHPDEDQDDSASEALRSLYERVMRNIMSVYHRQGVNNVTISVFRSKYRQLILTLVALVVGMAAGILLKATLPDEIASTVSTNLFAPVSTMFLNALKMIVGPLVFFSIASSVADFGDMKALGRIVGKVVGGYMFTSVVAILIGILVWHIIPIGNPELQGAVDASAASSITGQSVTVNIKDTIVGIIPKDIVSPFLNANMLQIIFMSVIVGVVSGLLSKKLQLFKPFLSEGYTIFSRITSMIIGVMPVAIFCSMAKMVLAMKLNTLLSVFSWVPVCYAGCILMIVVYGLMILVFGRLNPLTFFRKYYPAMLTAYTFASSNAALPTSMEHCDRSLGISRRIYSISLPLGATINMDGSCVVLCVSALFMAKIFGIPVTLPLLLTLAFSVFVLSIGAPGVPGAALVCLSILLPQLGMPSEAISLVMGLYSLIGMILVCTNVTGDAVMTLIVAKAEKQLDLKVYNSTGAAHE